MAVTIAEINQLRQLTSAGMMDCKKALTETNGDMDAAVELLRKKGQAVAAKREDRQAAEGCVLAKNEGDFAAIVALCCETDFVAKNAGFVALTQKLLDAAVANRIATLDDLKNLEIDGLKVADLITEESGKTGEKIEIGRYESLSAPSTTSYNHLGNHLSTIAGFNQENVDYQVGRDIAMQIASMNPVAIDRDSVAEETKKQEFDIAVEKTKQELVKKDVEHALKQAGINPNLVDSDDHIASNITKGWLTEDEAAKAREIIATVSAASAAKLPEAKINAIANGRLNKYFKENCLMEQEFVKDGKLTIGQYLEQSSKGLLVVSFKRVNLNQD
ncbi:MAG: elongation factor Ts [Bacteroidales bacterium]|nr:elongation factor Ts [Bacteroidales bacterium]